MEGIKRSAKNMFIIFNKQRVTRSAAAMSYYITISIFPLLIVVYAILTSLNITEANISHVLEEVIPADALNVILEHLNYVGGNESGIMLFVGITVTLSSSATAFGTLMKIMEDIQGKPRFKGFWAGIYNIIISVGFLAVIYVSALVIVSGEWLLDFLQRNLGYEPLLDLWQWVRFALLFFLLFVIIYLIYKATAPRERTKVRRMPGAAIASVLLVAVSIAFSRLIGMAVNYPIVYGSLASFIILMFWVYICSIILIMGNVYNVVVVHKTGRVKGSGENE
ncbi:MAG: YihY/virulence factor BrkB family protein [Clostridiales bacterium]|nr:YihY/virulence factor BrkB family protein [Clostridiales bacterium]